MSPQRKRVIAPSKAVARPAARAALMRSALTLFVRDGVDGTSIRDIATATPFTNAAIFRHFASKEALALNLFEQCYDDIATTVGAPIPSAKYPEQMRVVIGRYLQTMDENLEGALYMQENLRRFWPKLPKSPHRISLLGHMRGLIASGIQQGTVSPDKDQKLLVAAIIGLLGQFARMMYFKEFSGPATEFGGRLSELVIDMGSRRR